MLSEFNFNCFEKPKPLRINIPDRLKISCIPFSFDFWRNQTSFYGSGGKQRH